MSSFDEEEVVQFASVTGVEDLQIARQYLEFSNGDLSGAISLYFESGGSIGASQNFPNNQPQDETSIPTIPNQDDDFPNFDTINQTNGDALLAQQLSREYGQSQSHNSDNIDIENLDEFTPNHNSSPEQTGLPTIPPVSEIFADNPEVLNHAPDNFRAGSRSDLFMVDRAQPYIYQEAVRDEFSSFAPRRSSHGANSAYSRLQRACAGLVSNLPLNDARQRAKHLNKFVLVTLIDLSQNESMHGLVDFFSGKKQQELLKEKFLVVQYESNTPAGQDYTNFYPVRNYPHIAIIDPRTGERLKFWSRIERTLITPTLKHFLNHNSLTGKLEYPDVEPLPPKDVRDMSEQEQIDAAIQASLSASKFKVGSSSNNVPPIDIVDSESDIEYQQIESDDEPDETSLTPQQRIESIPAQDIPEPASGTPSTRIQFRLPDNSRVVKSMPKDTKVIALFQFIKLHVPSNAQEIEMICVRESISEKLNLTVTEASLENSALNVTYIEQ